MTDEDEVCTGMDVPIGPWGPEEVTFWTGTERYQPWKDVATFFREPTSEWIECWFCRVCETATLAKNAERGECAIKPRRQDCPLPCPAK